MHNVYVIKGEKDRRYYIGYTNDIKTRLAFHNTGKNGSTKNRGPFSVVYLEEFKDRKEALARERKIKSYKGGNEFKKLLENFGEVA